MSTATIQNSKLTRSIPQQIIIEYLCDSVDTTSNELIELTLLGPSNDAASYHNIPDTSLRGESYAIRLQGFSISCNSTDFDVRILNKNDITLLDTINEVISYESINKSINDLDFNDFIILNKDNSITNKLYLYINNDDTTETGTIRLQLQYTKID